MVRRCMDIQRSLGRYEMHNPSDEFSKRPANAETGTSRFRLLIAGVIGAAAALAGNGADARAVSGPVVKPCAVPFEFTSGRPADEACSRLPFDDRVELGEAAEQREELKTYRSAMERQVGGHFAETMRSCFAAIPNPETAPFVLIADITSEGMASAIEVRPPTNIARCFAAGVAKASFPRPPPSRNDDGFPITIKMRIE